MLNVYWPFIVKVITVVCYSFSYHSLSSIGWIGKFNFHILFLRFNKMITLDSNAQLGEKIWLETCRRIKVIWKHFTYFCWDSISFLQEIQLTKYYAAPEEKRKDIELNPYVIMRGAIENCRPLMSLQKVKVGAVTYYVPTPITESRYLKIRIYFAQNPKLIKKN